MQQVDFAHHLLYIFLRPKVNCQVACPVSTSPSKSKLNLENKSQAEKNAPKVANSKSKSVSSRQAVSRNGTELVGSIVATVLRGFDHIALFSPKEAIRIRIAVT